VRPDLLRIAVTEMVVGERAGSALGVMDDRDLEQRSIRHGLRGELGDEGDVVDDFWCNAPPSVAYDHRVAEIETEDVGGVDTGVEAGDSQQPKRREHGRPLVTAGGGEGAVACKGRLEAWDPELGPRGLQPSPLAGRTADRRRYGLFAHPSLLSC